jgi:hypothetical protein
MQQEAYICAHEVRTLAVVAKRPKTNEKAVRQQDGLLFQGRIVPTEFKKEPSELSGEILLGIERQCQGIFRE